MKHFYLGLAFCIFVSVHSQTKDFFETDLVKNPLHKNHIGKIVFTNRNIALDSLKETDFLKTYPLAYNSNLNIRVFMQNSVTNYMHQLAPELPAETLLNKGNLQFSFYVDGQFIYKENIHHGCNFGSGGNKNTSTTFRVPLTSTAGEDWWAMYMWDRFKANGGEKALTEGKHKLKIEIRPYVQTNENAEAKVGNLIAAGELQLLLKTPKLTAKEINIQEIKPNSDWQISEFPLDKNKIKALNAEIASHKIKDVTSVVVIREGRLLLEEYFNGSNRTTLHDTRSAGKSFASTLMGMAIHDGYIKDENQTLHDFYDLKSFANYEAKKDSIKISDLLTMSSAFEGSDANSDSAGNEENMYPTDNWVKFTLDLPVEKSKINGRQWDYFTAGVVLLGDMIHQKVPGGLEKYADEKLFKP